MNRLTRRFLNILILATVLFGKRKRGPVGADSIPVYMLTNHRHIYLAALAILGLDRHIGGLHYYVINHDSLSRFDQWLLHRMPVNLTIIDSGKQFMWLKRYPYNWAYYTQVWSGIKFFTTLFHLPDAGKCIVMDSDTLFLKKPERILRWIKDKRDGETLHLKDYMNFSVASPFEAERLIGVKVSSENLNSGLVCLNLAELHRKNSPEQINTYIAKITAIMKSRMTRDSYGKEELERCMYIIEQTLFQLLFSRMHHAVLPDTYALLTTKSFRNCRFVHFTPDGEAKDIYYRYLLFSLKTHIRRVVAGNTETVPWFCAADFADYAAVHLTKKDFRPGTRFFLRDLELNVED